MGQEWRRALASEAVVLAENQCPGLIPVLPLRISFRGLGSRPTRFHIGFLSIDSQASYWDPVPFLRDSSDALGGQGCPLWLSNFVRDLVL